MVETLSLPEPLTPADTDVRDLDGFMLNVERLMASELVALSSHEVVAAALFLWCRSWKQTPAASLPDDDRIVAAFARLPLVRFKKLKDEVLRGFVKCSDGRLYHRALAEVAVAAYERKLAFRKKRETDADRLRNWRAKQPGADPTPETHTETVNETRFDTRSEMCFVAEGEGGERKESLLRPKPAAPDRTRRRYSEDFERFWSGYPTDKLMSKQEAGKVWGKLTEDDRASAIAAIPGFVTHCRKNPTYRAVHACRFLSERRFDGFAPTRPTADASAHDADPLIEFPGGFRRRESFVRKAVEAWGRNPHSWHVTELGGPPNSPGCRVPKHLLQDTAA